MYVCMCVCVISHEENVIAITSNSLIIGRGCTIKRCSLSKCLVERINEYKVNYKYYR